MTTTAPAAHPEFEELLVFLRDMRSFDFSGYKRTTLQRRVDKRMQTVGVQGYPAYRDYLEVHPGEFEALFNTILINVTSFFRDEAAWATLRDDFVPALLERKKGGQPIRVWSAGCATGQETYSLVMLLAEAMGIEAFRHQVKVYATDLDNEALAEARHAVYADKDLEGLPEGFRDRYFEAVAGRWTFRTDLRRQVIFGRHDLAQDAPMSHLDLLTCRNVLMYFNSEVQGRILARFHFALQPEGLLFLGRAEMIRAHASLFTAANLGARVFRRAPSGVRERVFMLGRGVGQNRPSPSAQQLELRDAALDALPSAQLVVGPGGDLLLANEAARKMFAVGAADLGRPLQDLRVSYRPVELRSRIDQVLADRLPVYLSGVEQPGPDGDVRSFDVQVCPLGTGAGTPLGVSISFNDVTRHTRLQAEVEHANQALETAFEELQSTNEELETTNEELQSTIEELETTNEELQSTNEELETMNEELQSTNEEMETLNDEVQRRSQALEQSSVYLASVLASLRAGVVVVDREMLVQLWNGRMEQLWGLRADEVQDQPFLHLDIGLPVERMKGALRAVLDGRAEGESLVLEAVNRRGRGITCEVSVMPLVSAGQETRGAVVVVEERAAQGG
ncbi:MAG: Multidomain signal transduction protein including CheB-like methylesterase, CheR-like methyltransferase and BaeS-like histidine kinase [uncultured Gemmatimonadetes bacterium]|uniref:protein-glutamate O-methyltransferase n=1 Tax=uncultured Gemmatimonadota bacterium TaxID=203437 RepID=A0A6J4MX58_9BACT|nr:MAG: Multidomain signal transduction protein including CheB-like methylesterase, CheR-like methyltransferase and BaeS-like histidine kinase [uncultured Gemmatimonadota bacterium]